MKDITMQNFLRKLFGKKKDIKMDETTTSITQPSVPEHYKFECSTCKKKGWIGGRTKLNCNQEYALHIYDRLFSLLSGQVLCGKCLYSIEIPKTQ